ncbi:MAG: GC-type dockerin domain-anchored protein, partial [Planctomycetota bacterium]
QPRGSYSGDDRPVGAGGVDLSADMNADLMVDEADALKIITDIMDTEVGDLDLDGDRDADDLAIATANLGTGTTYSQGDVDFDGDVDNDDLALFSDACNAADLALPFGVLDLDDADAFIAAFIAGDAAADLAPPAGVIDLDDVDAFIAAFLGGCP